MCFVSIDCGLLLPLDNGFIHSTIGLQGNNTLNATATYTCNLGYNLLGSAHSTCTETSEWFPTAPNCTLSKTTFHSSMHVAPYYISVWLYCSGPI